MERSWIRAMTHSTTSSPAPTRSTAVPGHRSSTRAAFWWVFKTGARPTTWRRAPDATRCRAARKKRDRSRSKRRTRHALSMVSAPRTEDSDCAAVKRSRPEQRAPSAARVPARTAHVTRPPAWRWSSWVWCGAGDEGEGSGGKPGHVACVDKSGMVHVLDPPGSMLHTPDDVVVRSDGAIYFSDGDYCPVGTRTGYNAKLPVYLIGVRALGSRVAVLRLRLGRNGDTMRSFAAFCAPRSCPLVLFVAACSSQAPPSYTGEALATLRGAVVADGGATDGGPPAAAKAAVLWYGIRALIGTSSPVQGSFPARFTMSLYAPPPKTLGDPLPPETAAPNFTLDRGPLTLGWIVALAPEANEDDVHPEDVLGYSLDTMIAYVDDTDPRTPKDQVARYAALWQFPPIRGYHLVKIARSDRSAYDQCTWNGLCEDNSTATSIDGFLTFIYSCLHQDYRACVTAMPDAPRCTWYHPGPQDDSFDPKKTNAACIQLEQDFPRRDDCQPPLRHVPNPDEFGSSITITMGSTFRDVFM